MLARAVFGGCPRRCSSQISSLEVDTRGDLPRLVKQMTFADKYEILEAVGRGRVETFVARKVTTDQRVLVYVFEGREQRPEEPTVQWVFESFRALAPSPPELVVETGRYNATSYAYLVTKLPDRTALQDWLRAYEAQTETAGQPEALLENMPLANKVHTGEQTSPRETPTSDQPTPLPTADQPEAITKVFEALRAKLKPEIDATAVPTSEDTNAGASSAFEVSPSGIDSAASPSVKPAPGEFTMEFLSGFDNERRAGVHSAPASDGTPTQAPCLSTGRLFTYSAEGKTLERRQDSVTEITGGKSAKSPNRSDTAELANLLRSSSPQPETTPPHTTSPEIAPANLDAIDGGEFTNFFQGPFDGEKPSATPELSPLAPRPEQSGDFTRLFGSMKEGKSPDGGETQAFNRASPAGAGEGTFTRSFDSPESPAKGSAVYHPEPEMGRGVDTREPKFSGVTEWPSPITVPKVSDAPADKPVSHSSSTSNLLQGAEPSFTSRYEPDSATRVFSGPGSNPVPNFSSLPAGPSDYTRIISGGVKPAIPSQEPPPAPGSQNGPSANISVPSTPSLPASPVPASSAYPQMSSVPSVAAPSVPQLPQLGIATPTATAPTPPTPWTLIIILNVLFILAVALVLYFALKH
jgi:hypothetical protein